ncbi:type VII secretion protein EccCb [Actinoplanes sp. LDG1-06]|uniref:Type VII secretion protein EccCb n=1 Tax=Paractinoplanes ovalisporus TaxID=2810368 RepID=A0ABS2A4M3_9ACTN|nr:type VII secretion protein EccCb [Actinoplanes ovalisporus]MBM2614239.1 type VII secretion protein EccCb [Actinoplanes ovalisporus]
MSAWTTTSPATSVLYQARTLLTPGALELACHAAVPAVLDAGFLHLLRVNFFIDPPVVLGYDVEAELLHSPLFQEAGDGLYEVDPPLRRRLLAGLDAAYGFERLRKVALLLEQYTNHEEPWQPRELEYAQRLTALSIVEPGRAADWLAGAQGSVRGQEALGQEWFVAMRERLTDQATPPANLAEETARLLARISVESVHALGQLALLPGADLAEITNALAGLVSHSDPAVSSLATEVQRTLRDVFGPGIPPDARRPDAGTTLLDLLGLSGGSSAELRQVMSRPRPAQENLRVPIGETTDGSPVLLDLKESALGGMGPHGLLIGATGSGKSELLRTLVTALAITHSSEALNFVMIDFRSGATFHQLDTLPHTAAVITNLYLDPSLLGRLSDALVGELVRRQELLRSSGNLASRREYVMARGEDGSLPSLLIVVDEFSELLAARPDLIDTFLQIGRVGRSLGVHLLLAGQRFDDGRLRGLTTHLSYRICLRTASAVDSRAMIGTTDAYELRLAPGQGYVREDGGPLVQFQAAYVSGAGQSSGSGFGNASLLEVVVESLRGSGPTARQVWLPPLRGSVTLDVLAGDVIIDEKRGLTYARSEWRDAVRVPLAAIDRPLDRRRDVLRLDLGGSNGHVGIVGASRSGKGTALRTFVCSLALARTPDEVHVYCLDLGGHDVLAPLRRLPHVGGVAESRDANAVRETVAQMINLVDRRERLLTKLGLTSIDAYRAQPHHQNLPDVFLVVADWAALRYEHPDLEPVIINNVVRRGLTYGVHVVATAKRWEDFRADFGDLLGTRVELRLDDPADSVIDPRAAAELPHSPGHGITRNPADGTRSLHLVIARPELEGRNERELIQAIADNWHGARPPNWPPLPPIVPYMQMIFRPEDGLRLPIGIAEADLRQVDIDLGLDPNFLVFGDHGCGKTTFLRALARTIRRRFNQGEAEIALIDYQSGLRGITGTTHASTTRDAESLIALYTEALRARMPGPEVTAGRRRDRSWWEGPELFVLVDDYELLTDSPDNPLLPLIPHVLLARDIGLHIILTARTRAADDPVLERLRRTETHGLVMSGSPETGALIGAARPTPMAPGQGRLVTHQSITSIQLYHLPPS